MRVRQAVYSLNEEKEFRKVRRQLEAGDAFIYHLSEGTDPALRAEYEAMGSRGCIAPRFVGIHCTALGDDPVRRLDAAGRVGRVVAVLEPVAVRRDDGCAGGAGARAADLPRVGLGFVGHEEPSWAS